MPDRRPFAVRLVTVLWPAFLAAGVLEMLTFAVLDPSQMRAFGASSVPTSLSVEAIYTLTFLIYWAAFALTSAVTHWLLTSPARLLRG